MTSTSALREMTRLRSVLSGNLVRVGVCPFGKRVKDSRRPCAVSGDRRLCGTQKCELSHAARCMDQTARHNLNGRAAVWHLPVFLLTCCFPQELPRVCAQAAVSRTRRECRKAID
jgi:hypothetical protein